MLVVDIILMALLALVFLRQRRMNWMGYVMWGFVAVGLPLIGPFFVIASRPGTFDPSYSIQSDFMRIISWMRRLLPEPPHTGLPYSRARLRKAVRKKS
jgi:hypothetical protein